jgi:hypothetical protein
MSSLTQSNVNLVDYEARGSNPLNVFSSFNYLFTLSCMTPAQSGATTIDVSELNNIVISSKGDWNNRGSKRVQTNFGSYDYFIDDVIVTAIISPNERTGSATGTKITFKVTEPYSVGLFLLTLQQGAKNAGYDQHREAPYLLTIEFKGYNDKGEFVYNPELNRYIPLKFTNVIFKITEAGSVYECEAIPYNEIAYRDHISRTLTDVRIEGSNVREVLTIGDNSLQTSINRQRVITTSSREIENPDEYRIYFPRDFTDTDDTGNEISQSTLFSNYNDNGTVRFANQTDVFNAARQIRRQDNLPISEKKNFHFQQSTKIEDIITSIIIRSDYIARQILEGQFQPDPNGMINWFRIEPHVRDLQYNSTYGRQSRQYIYRIIPYKVHISRFLPPNAAPNDYENLSRTVNRVYDYIYTGKNTEVLEVNIEYKMGYFIPIPGDSTNRVGTNSSATGLTTQPEPLRRASSEPIQPDTAPDATAERIGMSPPRQSGGSGNNNAITEQTLLLKSVLENPGDLVNLEMQIRGDPYYLPTSGMGNQIRTPAGTNVLEDGSMNYQSRQIDIILNFRTPLDIDPVTGLYKFSLTLDQFSGLFQVISVESKFNGGKFTQSLNCIRRRLQYGPSQTPTRSSFLQSEPLVGTMENF